MIIAVNNRGERKSLLTIENLESEYGQYGQYKRAFFCCTSRICSFGVARLLENRTFFFIYLFPLLTMQ